MSSFWTNQLSGPTDPVRDANWVTDKPRKGFFTDTSICIGCKACEVACKEWNRVPTRGEDEHGGQMLGTSYDNTGHLGANTWRHVAFIEQDRERQARAKETGRVLLGMPGLGAPQVQRPAAPAGGADAGPDVLGGLRDGVVGTGPDGLGSATSGDPQGLPAVRWLMSSDVCKHCTHAGCLDVCPTGALFRTEFGTVVVQPDVCNGCGYCVASCPFGVIGRRENGTVEVADGRAEKVLNGGVAQKCTLCYDRLLVGEQPACAKTCPTQSITFGDHEDMVAKARERLAELHAQGHTEARLYGANPADGVGGTGSIFLLMDEPEAYGLPPDPEVTTKDLGSMFTAAGFAGTGMIAVAIGTFLAFGRRK